RSPNAATLASLSTLNGMPVPDSIIFLGLLQGFPV
ncbi:hypothetical protein AAULR_13614, partial [Lacticaseibacillus rhamnosus MTCC 5462]